MFDPSAVFGIANTSAALAWLLLLLSPPGRRWTPAVWRFTGRVMPFALGLLYVVLLAVHWRGEGGFGSLAEVQALFGVPGVLVAGWVHYLAFDLFVGTWIAQRAAALELPHWQVVPVLLLTFLFGPAGWLAFVLLRSLRRPSTLTWQVAP